MLVFGLLRLGSVMLPPDPIQVGALLFLQGLACSDFLLPAYGMCWLDPSLSASDHLHPGLTLLLHAWSCFGLPMPVYGMACLGLFPLVPDFFHLELLSSTRSHCQVDSMLLACGMS